MFWPCETGPPVPYPSKPPWHEIGFLPWALGGGRSSLQFTGGERDLLLGTSCTFSGDFWVLLTCSQGADLEVPFVMWPHLPFYILGSEELQELVRFRAGIHRGCIYILLKKKHNFLCTRNGCVYSLSSHTLSRLGGEFPTWEAVGGDGAVMALPSHWDAFSEPLQLTGHTCDVTWFCPTPVCCLHAFL